MTEVKGPSTVAPFDLEQTDRLLSTTRSVRRRLDLDRPVPVHLIEECLELAVQAPTAENEQNWRWLVLTEQGQRRKVADLFELVWWFHRRQAGSRASRRMRNPQNRRIQESVASLAETIGRVPVLVIPCVLGPPPDSAAEDAGWRRWVKDVPDGDLHRIEFGSTRVSRFYGSIYPAVWSLQLALRARGLGSTLTLLHLPFGFRVAEELGIPKSVTQICMLAVGWTKGTDFRPAKRIPARSLTFWNRWGAPEPPASSDVLDGNAGDHRD
jgi:nitroreductase